MSKLTLMVSAEAQLCARPPAITQGSPPLRTAVSACTYPLTGSALLSAWLPRTPGYICVNAQISIFI